MIAEYLEFLGTKGLVWSSTPGAFTIVLICKAERVRLHLNEHWFKVPMDDTVDPS